MVEPATITRRRWPGTLTIRGWLLLIASAALGIVFGLVAEDWQPGAMAAISLWVVLGLASQVHDLWTSPAGNGALTREERRGWRFAVAWRVVVASLIVACFLLRLLVARHVLAIDDGRDIIFVSWTDMVEAVLLISMVAAVGSSPRLARRKELRPGAWIVGLLAGVAVGVLCAILLTQYFVVPFLVHISIFAIEMSQPMRVSVDALATYDPRGLFGFLMSQPWASSPFW